MERFLVYLAVFLASLACTTLFIMIWQNQHQLQERLQPVEIINSFALDTNVIEQGGTLHVTYNTSRYEACRVIISRFIINMDETIVWSSQTHAINVGAGKSLSGTKDLVLPSFVPPGDYIYRAFVHNSDCQTSGRSITIATDDLRFTIKPMDTSQ